MKTIAVVAHDRLKQTMVDFLKDHQDWIPQVKLLATGRTAETVEENKIANVEHLKRGRYGGYNEITDRIKEKGVDMVIFFRDWEVETHHEDIRKLLATCNQFDIPLATNPSTAELLIIGFIHKEKAERNKQFS